MLVKLDGQVRRALAGWGWSRSDDARAGAWLISGDPGIALATINGAASVTVAGDPRDALAGSSAGAWRGRKGLNVREPQRASTARPTGL